VMISSGISSGLNKYTVLGGLAGCLTGLLLMHGQQLLCNITLCLSHPDRLSSPDVSSLLR